MSTSIYRDQGDTAPALAVQLLVGGSPFTLSGASVTAVIGGTVGSAANATYQRFVLPATWTAASAADASVTIPLNPSGLAPGGLYPCATPARYLFEVRAVDSTGLVYQWPSRQPIPFIVRLRA